MDSSQLLGAQAPTYVLAMIVLLFILMVWTLIWKGWALWQAARQGSKVWFVVLLIVNTVGILDILYIFVFARKKGNPEVNQPMVN